MIWNIERNIDGKINETQNENKFRQKRIKCKKNLIKIFILKQQKKIK